MAKIEFSGAGITQIRGSAGGSTFSRNASGAYWRTKVTPTNPQTTRQTAVRASFSALTGAWRGLTDAERTAWATVAPTLPYQDALGQSKIYTGQQLFMSLNGSLRSVAPSAALLASPPAAVSAPALVLSDMVVEVDPGVDINLISLVASTPTIPTDFALEVFATPGLSSGIMRPSAGLFRQLEGTPAFAAGIVQTTVMYAGLFSVPFIGQKVYQKIWAVSLISGQRFLLGTFVAVVTEA